MSTGTVVQVVRSDAFAGVERYVVAAATELHTRGWDVVVIGGDVASMRRDLPAGVRHLPGASMPAVAQALWSIGRCDVVHAHMTAAELVAVLLKRRNKAKVVITRHFAAPRSRSVRGRLARQLIRRTVDEQVAISQFVADVIAEPALVIPSGLVARDALAAHRDRTVLVLQRLEPEKDTATAVRAWAASGLPSGGWRLVIHGKGSEERVLRALAAELGVGDSVEFGGAVDDPRSVLGRAAMLVAPTPAEGLGLAVVEAMAEGTPVVASQSGGHVETLGADGMYFDAGDAQGCAEQLVRLAASTQLRSELGRRLQGRQRRLFSVSTQVDALEQVYRR